MSLSRVLTTLAVPCAAASIAWVGGYDFDSRGFWPAYALLVTLAGTFFVWALPGWDS